MAFRKNPVIEEPDRCLVCKDPVEQSVLICSATCHDLWEQAEQTASRESDWNYDAEEALYA